MRRTLFLYLVILPVCFFYGQDKKDFENQPELLENIHLQLNKTTFLKKERLWFKAYVRDQNTKLPSMETANLHVGIYNNNGREIKRKLLYIENGIAHGDFAIDSTLTDTKYTLLAWTNYMRNFKELPPYRQKIRILGNEIEEESREVNVKLSVYPEGGQLIAGAYNNIGILVENGLGQGISLDNLELVDEVGNVVRRRIATNRFGMGKTGFMVNPKSTYFIQLRQTDSSVIRERLPETVDYQLGLNIDNNGKEKVLVTLLASRKLFSERTGEVYTMAFYQDDFIRFEEVEVNEGGVVLSIKRKELPFGIITSVLFDTQLQPIGHRMFFNHRTDSSIVQDLEVDHCLSEFGDSLQVDLILPKGEDMNFSLSALPIGSKAYHPDNSIASSFLIRPYIKSYFQDQYFFFGQDRKKRFELDKRLLIEGWGKYDWNSRRLEEIRKTFEMETGIPFQGRIIDADLNEESQVSLVAELSSAMGFEELDENKFFKGTIKIFEGDSLGVSLISKKGKLRKPNAEVRFGQSSISIVELNKWLDSFTFKKQLFFDDEKTVQQPMNIGERTIALDEVTVTERAIQNNKTPMFVPRGTLLPIMEGRIIGDAEIKRYGSVMSYLTTLGYSRTTGKDRDGFFIDVVLSPKSGNPVGVSGNINLPLSRVQAVYYDIDKKFYINIVPRSTLYVRPEDRNKFLKFVIEKGYSLPQDYFTPNYRDYDSQVFKTFGALDWKANISVNSDIPTSITIPINNQNGVQLYIEGMNPNGELVSIAESIVIK